MEVLCTEVLVSLDQLIVHSEKVRSGYVSVGVHVSLQYNGHGLRISMNDLRDHMYPNHPKESGTDLLNKHYRYI